MVGNGFQVEFDKVVGNGFQVEFDKVVGNGFQVEFDKVVGITVFKLSRKILALRDTERIQL